MFNPEPVSTFLLGILGMIFGLRWLVGAPQWIGWISLVSLFGAALGYFLGLAGVAIAILLLIVLLILFNTGKIAIE